ncbi:MAG: ISNCY family transposase [Candidatus Omnitrophica bacterium]|nr:ISNCY family transposase [Candidatus Omnitrophota bacterium]
MYPQKLVVTMKDLKRHRIIQDTLDKRLSSKEASMLLSLSYRQFLRLKEKVKSGGLEAILRPSREAPNKIPGERIKKIIKLRKEIYYDFNIRHFMDTLYDDHKIHCSYESLRQILIDNNEHNPKKRKKIHRQRRRMPKAGLLEQMDSSQHRWLHHIKEKWWLIAIIDDATNEVPYAVFVPKDTLFANMHVIRRFIEIKGVFTALYVDKASHFKTTRHGGLHVNVSQEQEDTQIERALGELGIEVIPANSPQAKGRIEVTFRLFQDRLIKKMRVAKIKDYADANTFLIEKFLPRYNQRFTHEAESAYTALPLDKNLDHVFCIKKERIVGNDNVVKIYSQIIQIPPSKIKRTFAKLKVDVCLLEDKRIIVLYKDHVVAESTLSKNNKIVKKERKIEKILNQREYVFLLHENKPKRGNPRPKIPGKEHPWRKFPFKTQQIRGR